MHFKNIVYRLMDRFFHLNCLLPVKRHCIFLPLLLLFMCKVMAQNNIRINDYWDNTYYINPAGIHESDWMRFSTVARKQWLNFPGAPTTFFATSSIYLKSLRTQFGLKAMMDQAGYTNISQINLSYGYLLPINEGWALKFGLAGTYQSISFDMDKISSADSDDPDLYEHYKRQDYLNADLGFELTDKFWTVGVVSQNIPSLFFNINKQFSNTNFVYASYRQYNHDYINLGFGACAIQERNVYQMEFNAMSYFKLTQEMNAFQVGLFYRTWREMGVMFGIDLSKNLFMTYNYDFNIGEIRRKSLGTHELMLVLKLKPTERCVNCWY